MERHSVPQNIMDVEFKLFGALTIKQFGYLAGGIVVGLIFYFTDLPFLLKGFLIIFSVVMGLFLSLVKINGQQSSTWLSNFVTALFSSQQRLWQKKAVTPEVLKESKAPIKKETVEFIRNVTRLGNPSRKIMPLASITGGRTVQTLDEVESDRLNQIEEHFDFAVKNLQVKPQQDPAVSRSVTAPAVPAKLKTSTPQTRTIIIDQAQDNLAGDIAEKTIDGQPIAQTPNYAAIYKPVNNLQPNRPIGSLNQEQSQITPAQPTMIQAEKLEIPEAPAQQLQEPQTEQQTEVQSVQTQVEAEVTPPVTPPIPRKPNIISGIVTTKEGKPLAGAQVSIKDEKENLVRKLVTTSGGTFGLTTPLASGKYFIDISAEANKFARFELLLNGLPLPNYKFSAK